MADQNIPVTADSNVQIDCDNNNNDTNRYIQFTHNNGTELMRVQENGNVGIGTTNPRSLLQIDSSSSDHLKLRVHSETYATDDVAGMGFGVDTSNQYMKSAIVHQRKSSNGRGDLLFCVDSNNDGANVAVSDEKMRIDSDGNVGIGTTNPGLKLSVDGDVETYDGHFIKTDKVRARDGDGLYLVDDDDNGIFIQDGGEVGIGTTDPQGLLHINSGAAAVTGLMFSYDDGGGYDERVALGYSSSDLGYLRIFNPGGGWHVNLTGMNDSYMRGGFNFGLGTPTPASILQVSQAVTGRGTVTTNGTTTLTGTSTQFTNTFKSGDTITVDGETVRTVSAIASDTSLTVTSAFSTSASGKTYVLSGGDRFVVKGNGNVGIGTTSPDESLHVYGSQANIELSDDSYPTLQILNYSHDNMSLNFDSYYRNGWKSSDSGSNFRIYKIIDKLLFSYASGVSQGSTISDWASQNGNVAIAIDSGGKVGIGTTNPNNDLEVVGTIQCDALRIDQDPTSGSVTPAHYFTINFNGTPYQVPCFYPR